MSVRTDIEGKLALFASTQSPPIPIAYENVKFMKPTDGKYLEIKFLDSYTDNRELSAKAIRQTGKFQVNCYCPLGAGMRDLEDLADSIIAIYPVIPKLGTVSIESPLDSTRALIIDTSMCIVVTGSYRAEF